MIQASPVLEEPALEAEIYVVPEGPGIWVADDIHCHIDNNDFAHPFAD